MTKTSFISIAVNRTRKQIRLLEGKNYGLAQTGKTPRDIPKQSVEMELELTQHWKSLFLHTDSVLERETTQLVSCPLNHSYVSNFFLSF